MKKLLLFFLIASATNIAFSQNTNLQNTKKCATQDKLDEVLKKDPDLLKRLKEQRESNPKWIELNKFSLRKTKKNHLVFPGFTPTGDPKIDKINLKNAKEKLITEDPDAHEKLMEKNKKESILKRREIIKSQNNKPQN